MMRPDIPSLARYFKALGDPTRLRIYCFLRAKCIPIALSSSGEVRPMRGQTVGEVCCYLTGKERACSSVSFHLKELRTAGLIDVTRRGRHLVCAVNAEAARVLGEFFDTGGLEPTCCIETMEDRNE